ncbi:hypothetical protein Btru_021689 [Bulinus truncatus]|nr:hypothetical protein Btru_021689 [Bulinus truncatus]
MCEWSRCEESRCEEGRCEGGRCEGSRCVGGMCKWSRGVGGMCEESRCEEGRCEGGRCEGSRCVGGMCKWSRGVGDMCEWSRCEESRCEESRCEEGMCEGRRCEWSSSNLRQDHISTTLTNRDTHHMDRHLDTILDRHHDGGPLILTSEFCGLEAVQGPCRGAHDRHHYDAKGGACYSFKYGGCGGNRNNFQTREECESVCMGAGGSAGVALANVQTKSKTDASHCYMQPESGHCKGSITMYHYDPSTLRCFQFQYSGCGGNENRFDTQEGCLANCTRPVDVCQEKAEVGRCKAMIPRFHFNSSIRQCQLFYYGGCGGNGNSFETKEQCEGRCLGAAERKVNQEGKASKCLLSPEVGPCKAQLSRYHYDQSSDTCSNFMYGGCGGNENNFQTREECEEVCTRNRSDGGINKPVTVNSLTKGIPEIERRNRSLEVHGKINKRLLGQSEWGILLFNQNAMLTTLRDTSIIVEVYICWSQWSAHVNDIVRILSGVNGRSCVEKAEVVRCKAMIPRFHFNSSTRQCQLFYYGGCGGNGNSFETKEQCEGRCLGAAERKVNLEGKASKCLQPPDVGPCKAQLSRYHYDQSSDTCSNFMYGGCGGNENNFQTREECEGQCLGRRTIDGVDDDDGGDNSGVTLCPSAVWWTMVLLLLCLFGR